MCGRMTQLTPARELADHFSTREGLDVVGDLLSEPRYNVAPSQPLAAVRWQEGQRAWALLKWGLVPSWADDPSIGDRMINARSETVGEKPSFRSAFRKRRCLIPADGFYEWRKRKGGGAKTPYYIQRWDGAPLALAGLWEHWTAPDGSAHLQTCTILTTTPNDVIAPLHHRMPVIIPREAFDLWLRADASEVTPLLGPNLAEEMEAYPVSTVVNYPGNDTPACIEPVEAEA